MKILVAYDGSDCADAALKDLKRAGLPVKSDAVVMSMADVFLPPPINEEVDDTFPFQVPAGVRRAHERAQQKLKEAESMAQRASDTVRQSFTEWKVTHEALAQSPAWGIILKAWEWKPDLVVVGAQGHSVFGGRLILGSVSQRVLYEAGCSVRIARESSNKSDAPLRIIIAVDNSTDSKAAVEAVCRRHWSKGTEVRLVTVVDTVMALKPDPSEPEIWVEVDDENNWDQVRAVFEPLATKLRATGLEVEIVIRSGSPADKLVEEAGAWRADCVFVGAKGTRGIERLLLGSVSSAVAARAHCSVEVVRPR